MDDLSFLLGETSILDDFKSTRGRNSDAFWWKKLNWEPAQVSLCTPAHAALIQATQPLIAIAIQLLLVGSAGLDLLTLVGVAVVVCAVLSYLYFTDQQQATMLRQLEDVDVARESSYATFAVHYGAHGHTGKLMTFAEAK